MQVGRTLAIDIDLVATPVILEGDMKRLMNVAYPVAQILEGEKLLLLARRGRRQDIEVLLNSGDDAFSRARTKIRGKAACTGTPYPPFIVSALVSRCMPPSRYVARCLYGT